MMKLTEIVKDPDGRERQRRTIWLNPQYVIQAWECEGGCRIEKFRGGERPEVLTVACSAEELDAMLSPLPAAEVDKPAPVVLDPPRNGGKGNGVRNATA